MAEESFKLNAPPPSGSALPPAIGANYVNFTYVGEELQLLFGTFDLYEIHTKIKDTKAGKTVDPNVVPTVTHRFLLSPLGVSQFRARALELIKALDEAEKDKK